MSSGALPAGEVTRLFASALTTVDALGRGPAAAVTADLDTALAVRGLTRDPSGLGQQGPGWPLLTPGPSPQQAPGQRAIAGSRAVPLAAVVPVRLAGQHMRLDLLACLLTDSGTLFVASGTVALPGHPHISCAGPLPAQRRHIRHSSPPGGQIPVATRNLNLDIARSLAT